MISRLSPGAAYGLSSLGQPTARAVRYWNHLAPYQSGIIGTSSTITLVRSATAAFCADSWVAVRRVSMSWSVRGSVHRTKLLSAFLPIGADWSLASGSWKLRNMLQLPPCTPSRVS